MKLRNLTIIGSLCTGLILLFGAVVSCSSTTSTTTNSTPSSSTTTSTSTSASTVSFTLNIQPIFTANCVVCHQGSSPPAGMSLEPGNAYRNLVNIQSTESSLKRVAPSSPSLSYLINKLMGTQAQAGGSGAQMPYGGTPLSAAQINTIQQWISQGAPNN